MLLIIYLSLTGGRSRSHQKDVLDNVYGKRPFSEQRYALPRKEISKSLEGAYQKNKCQDEEDTPANINLR